MAKKSKFKRPRRQGPMTRMKPKAARVRHEPSSVPNAAEEGVASDADYELRPLGSNKNRIRLGPSVEAEIRRPQTLLRGVLEFTRDQIPSVTEGKSPAMDFTHALMQGNPYATEKVDELWKQQRARDKPALADMFFAETFTLCKRLGVSAHQAKLIEPILQTYRRDIKSANRFVLDNDFVRYITDISSTITAEKLLARVQYATLPYELTWIEFNLREKVRVMRRIHGMSDEGFDYDDVAERLGLIMRRLSPTTMSVEMVCETHGNHGLIGTTICYFFSVDEHDWAAGGYFGCRPLIIPENIRRSLLEGKVDEEARRIINDDKLLSIGSGSLWGYTVAGQGTMITKTKQMREIGLPIFLARHGCLGTGRMKEIIFQLLTGKQDNDMAVNETVTELMLTETIEFTGMMRWIVCVWAAINEVPISTRHVEQKGTIRTSLTQRRPLMDHHVVTLRVPKTKPIQWIEKQFRLSVRRRAHKVMQHWRTYVYEQDNCANEHEWQYDYEERFAVCGRCTAYRRLILEHKRGDESLGWVQKSYVVKPEKQP